MPLEEVRNVATIITGVMAFIALAISISTYRKHKERYIQQKAYEWSIDKLMENLELTHKAWRLSTKLQTYVSYLATIEKNGSRWSILEEKENSPSQMEDYQNLQNMLLDLYYFFNNTSNPLVLQAIDENELSNCFSLLKIYEPFTIATFVELEKNNNFKNIHNDLLKIQTIINRALAKKIK